MHPITGESISAVNLLSGQGLRDILSKAVTNFTGFAPVGTVLVAVMGGGAEWVNTSSAAKDDSKSPATVDDAAGGICRCDV